METSVIEDPTRSGPLEVGNMTRGDGGWRCLLSEMPREPTQDTQWPPNLNPKIPTRVSEALPVVVCKASRGL